MIHLKNFNFSYGEKQIFKDAGLQLSEGDYFVVGLNGSGKSTLLTYIAENTSQSVSYLPPAFSVNEHLSVRDVAEIYGFLWDQISTTTIFKLLNSLQMQESFKIQRLSSGERQRFILSLLLLQDREILILDEPFNFLDWQFQQRALQAISTSAFRVKLITTHDLQAPLRFTSAKLLLIQDKKIHDLGLYTEAIISEKLQNSFHFQSQIIDNPIDRSLILAIAEKK